MSTLFRFSPSSFVKHDDFELFNDDNIASLDGVLREPERNQNCKNSAAPRTSSVLLRDDHLVLLAIDGLLALHTVFKKWRNRRLTLRALSDLDERQLRGIGLTRDEAFSETPLCIAGPPQELPGARRTR